VALDRQSIEKRDFPAARRGYSPDAVDAHLSAIANEVEELRGTTERPKSSMADTASDQVRSILEAAQTTAAQIRSEAEEEARRVRDAAHDHVEATRAGAAAQADEHVSQVSKSTADMLERIERIDEELNSLFDVLRGAAKRINAQLGELQVELHAAADAGPASAPEGNGTASAEEPAEETEPGPAAAAPHEPERTVAAPGDSDEEGARLIALNMALNGSPREEIDRFLTERYDLADQASLLDEVFASVCG
jgi:vacuolar-type H+-ATPase subunit H